MQTVIVCSDVKYVQRLLAEQTICMHMLTNAMKKILSCTNVIPARKHFLKSSTWSYTWIFTQELHGNSANTVREVFLNVSSNCLHEQMHSYIGCICMTFLHCAFSNVSSNCLHQRMQSYIGCTCFTFLHYVFLNVYSNCQPERRHSHTGCIYLTIPSTGSQNRPRFSQLPFWSADF